jgi:flagellar basal-body rod protein FlgF
MDPITAIAASGLRSRMESLDMLANNIANASTGGYKADREFYSLFISPDAAESGAAVMPLIEKPWVDLSQGAVHPTGGQLDFALAGPGFFAVDGAGETLYTRNGSFRLSSTGKLVTTEGYAVRGADGAALSLDPARPIEVQPDGSIHQGEAVVGKLAVVDFADSKALVKRSGNYFRSAGAQPVAAENTEVKQAHLESSNTGPAEAAVRLVAVMRQFEMLQKAAALAGDMGRQAVEVVAKVG